MEQLSRPYQIALGALVVLALAWFLVLKPSDEVSAEPLPGEAATAPGQAGLGTAVAKARGAVRTSSSAAAAVGGEPATSPPPASAAAPAPGTKASKPAPAAAPEAQDPSAPLLRAVRGGKVAVVLFSSAAASDDRKVRRALATADRHDGRVVVRSVPIADVAKWSAITEGVDVLQSPTLLVIGEGNLARSLVGFTDTRGIDQLVADVGGPAFVSTQFKGYRGRVENLCSTFTPSAVGNLLGQPDLSGALQSLLSDVAEIERAVTRLDPPRRYVRFHRLFLQDIAANKALMKKVVAAERTAPGSGLPIFEAGSGATATSERRFQIEGRKVGLDAC